MVGHLKVLVSHIESVILQCLMQTNIRWCLTNSDLNIVSQTIHFVGITASLQAKNSTENIQEAIESKKKEIYNYINN